MRLFSRPDGKVDHLDRASWMTPGFDLPFDDGTNEETGTVSGNQRKWLPRPTPQPRKLFRRVGR